MSFYENLVDPTAIDAIGQDFFMPHDSVISIGLDVEGNRIRENKFTMGVWAGPQAEVSNLLHEMAHMIEIDDARCHIPSWGFKYGKTVYIAGRMINEGMFTNKAIEREIRVFGIQIVMMNHYGIDNVHSYHTWDDHSEYVSKARNFAEICDYIDGLLYYYPKGWCKEDKGKYTYRELKDYAFQAIMTRIEEETANWSMDEIMTEWDRKMQVLKAKQKRGIWKNYH